MTVQHVVEGRGYARDDRRQAQVPGEGGARTNLDAALVRTTEPDLPVVNLAARRISATICRCWDCGHPIPEEFQDEG